MEYICICHKASMSILNKDLTLNIFIKLHHTKKIYIFFAEMVIDNT